MKKQLALIGATAIALGITVQSVEAKKVTYEINGKRYSYSTNNRQQVATARKRIEAAKAADAAKAKAEAERAKNPLVSLFGSQAQREAAESQAKIEQAVTAKGKASAETPKATRTVREDQHKKDAKEKLVTAALAQEPARPKPSLVAAAMPSAAAIALVRAGTLATPMVKSVYFDAETGIKTIIMTDGSVHEEPFDNSMLSRLASDDGGPSSLTAFVNQVRKAYPVETTGSTLIRTAQPF
jgi:NADH dehydrogenase/NADH:ubiquinone oxidoreductase subunit G